MRFLRDINLTSLIVALVFIIVGGTVAFIASGYPIGTARHMGPGYFPIACGVLLVGLGLAVLIFEGFSSASPRAERPDVRSWFFIMASILVFAALIETMGLVPAVIATSLTSLLANPRFKPISAIVTSVTIAVLASAIFVWGLHFNVDLFKWVA